MKKIIIAICLCATPAAAQNCTTTVIGNQAYTNCYGSGNAFQDGYNAAGGNRPPPVYSWIARQNATEAMINGMRARRGVGPCAIAWLKQWTTGRPAC